MAASVNQTTMQNSVRDADPSAAGQIWLVDFDHTLLAANSTELFVGMCSPGLIIAMIDFVCRRLLPWRLTRMKQWYRTRDYVCFLAIAGLTPWNLWLWQRRAPALFARLRSAEVAEKLAVIDPCRIVIISFGNRFIIGALLRGSAYAGCRIIATPLRPSPRWFITGKATIARSLLGDQAVATATVLTDSEDDRDLLDFCADGQLIDPQGPANLARERLYLPLRYSGSVKFTRSFAIDQWLLVDSCIYGLSVAHGWTGLIHFAVIAPLLSLSFMAVYELGYFENDMEAARKEDSPTLSGKEARYRHYPIRGQSWVWAVAAAWAALALAVWLGELARPVLAGALLIWIALLIVSRVVFLIYNRLPPQHRMLTYPALQLSKYGSILAIFRPGVTGCLLVISQIATMWVNYVVYRLGGAKDRFPKEPFRLVLFLIMALVVSASWRRHTATASSPAPDIVVPAAITCWLALRIAKSVLMRRLKSR